HIPGGVGLPRTEADLHDRLDALEAVLPGHDEAQRRAVLVGQNPAVEPDHHEGERVHRLVDPQSLDVRPVEHPRALSRHLRRIIQRRELHVLGAGGGFEARQQVAQGKADPRHHERPRLDAAESIDAFLERLSLEQILKGQALEERIYRFRCVEAWSLVVPWVGFPLSDLLARFKPTSGAKYVQFTPLYDPAQMPGQRSRVLNWPYVEGLRIDEAMHPLALMVVGLYGRVLPNQDGAPLRLIVPWKYGFKSIKSIVQIRFSARQPDTAWNV